jgi:hypothetical protein
MRFNVHKVLEDLGPTTEDFRTRKARQRLAAVVANVLDIGYPDAVRLVTEIAGSLIHATRTRGARPDGVDLP